MVSIGSVARYSLIGGTVAMVAGIKPQTKGEEHFQNRMSTAATIGLIGATPFAVKHVIKAKPGLVSKVALKTGNAVEKVMVYVADKFPKIIVKVKNTKIGAKVLEYAAKAGTKVKEFIVSSPSLKKYATKAIDVLEKFAKATTATKGKYALLAAGVSLLAYTAFKTVTNYYKKEGAIDQKYSN